MSHAAALSDDVPQPVRDATIIELPIKAGTPRSTDWRDHGVCKDVDPEIFFSEDKVARGQARTLCGTCPQWVNAACLEHALTAPEPHGIWAGTTPHQRKRMLAEKDDSPRVRLLQAAAKRNLAIAEARRAGESVESIQERFKVSKATIYRAQSAN